LTTDSVAGCRKNDENERRMAGIVGDPALLPQPVSRTMRCMRRVVFVVYPGITALDLVGPHEVLGAAGGYELVIAATHPGPVATTRGPELLAQRSLAQLRGAIDTLVVVGGEGAPRAARDPALVRSVRAAAARSRRVASVCTGAFVLAAAGVLDGKRATTHWNSCDRLARSYPQVTVEPDPIYVRDGNVWTSAGVTAGMDLALALVADDHGRETALRVARQLVMYVQRPGGQSQFSAQLDAQAAGRDPIREVQALIGEHPEAEHTVERLAAHAHMSPRHFARVFRAEVGATPAVYVERTRVEAARRLLETTALSLDEIALATGFGTVDTFRRAFARRVGAGPGAYRERFRSFQPA
jgi:transcriptional regulator GlxA family with amidase domain